MTVVNLGFTLSGYSETILSHVGGVLRGVELDGREGGEGGRERERGREGGEGGRRGKEGRGREEEYM